MLNQNAAVPRFPSDISSKAGQNEMMSLVQLRIFRRARPPILLPIWIQVSAHSRKSCDVVPFKWWDTWKIFLEELYQGWGEPFVESSCSAFVSSGTRLGRGGGCGHLGRGRLLRRRRLHLSDSGDDGVGVLCADDAVGEDLVRGGHRSREQRTSEQYSCHNQSNKEVDLSRIFKACI